MSAKKTLLLTLAFSAILFPDVAAGQAVGEANAQAGEGPTMDEQIDRMLEYLDITGAKRENVRAVMLGLMENTLEGKQMVQGQRRELGEMLNVENPDACAIGQKMVDIRALTEELNALNQSNTTLLKNELTPDQMTRFKEVFGTGRQAQGRSAMPPDGS